MIFNLFLGLTGYVHMVTPEKTSKNNNSYFDVDINTSPVARCRVRVMADHTANRVNFVSIKDQGKAVALFNVSPLKAGKRFFNPKLGASFRPISPLEFHTDENKALGVASIIESPPDGVFDIEGQVKFFEYPRCVNVN